MKKNNTEVTARQVVGWAMMICGFFIMINSAIKIALGIKKVKRAAVDAATRINDAFDKAEVEIKSLEVPEEHIKDVAEEVSRKIFTESIKNSNPNLADMLEEMGFPAFK